MTMCTVAIRVYESVTGLRQAYTKEKTTHTQRERERDVSVSERIKFIARTDPVWSHTFGS